MRTVIFVLTFIYSLITYSQVAQVTNDHPKRGEEIIIKYVPDTTSFFDLSDEVYIQISLYKEDYSKEYIRERMIKVAGRFEYSLTIDPLASYYSVSFFDPDKYDRKVDLEVIPKDNRGRVFKNSFMGVAYSDSKAAEKERKLFPDNYAVDVPRWRNLQYNKNQDSVEQVIRGELNLIEKGIESFSESTNRIGSDESALYALTMGNVILKDFEKALKHYDLLLEKHPQSNLIEEAHSLYSYYLFSYSQEDSLFEERSKEFLKDHPTSAIGKRLIWQLDDSEESQEIMFTSTKYWMGKEPDEVSHYFMHAKSLDDKDQKRKYLSKALNKLFDSNLSVTHYYSWNHAIPRHLPRIMEGYIEAESYAEALALAALLEANTSKIGARIHEMKGQAHQSLNDYHIAYESYLEAESKGSDFASDSAKAVFRFLDVNKEYESFKEETKRRMFYEADVDPAPEFSVEDIYGNKYTLADLKGKAVVINFWFIGCAPCIVEMPGLNKLVELYEDEDVVFLAFALDSKSSLENFLEKKEFKYNIIASSREIADMFDVTGYPTHVILDKKGNVRSVLSGGSKDRHEDLIPPIDAVLAY
ncbi:peroxiredoxin family protein [Ekhidna sp.]|uniref:peroxiredoxin family protein n=1 Tax=Ekhidna sp. TaxID=2608089 RepID=UPI003B5C150B